MKILGREKLFEFRNKHSDASSQIDSWEAEAENAEWKTPKDIKVRYAQASFIAKNHVVFNIKGNKYRLLVQVNYQNKIILVKKVGTHEEYMKW
jgi:mRNA interferase HigB